jgi:hypothetical protein
MNLVVRVVQFLFVLFLIRMVVVMVRTQLIRAAQKPRAPRPIERAGGSLVRDPHCGTYVPAGSAITSGRGPDAVHFCSTTCRDAWLIEQGGRRGA